MNPKRYALVAAGLAAFTLLSGFHGGCGRAAFTPERASKYVNMRVDDELDDLKASPAQRQQVHAQVDALLPEALQLKEAQRAARAEALQALQADKPDAARLHALVDARVDAVRAFAHKVVDAVIATHQALTPEQRKQVSERVQARLE